MQGSKVAGLQDSKVAGIQEIAEFQEPDEGCKFSAHLSRTLGFLGSRIPAFQVPGFPGFEICKSLAMIHPQRNEHGHLIQTKA